MASPNESSMTLACHPPYLNPPDGSSSGPPGACMTPSIVTNVVVMIFRISGSLVNKGRRLRVDVPRRVSRPLRRFLRARVRGCEQRHENEQKTCLGIEASSVSLLPGLASVGSRSKGVEIDTARTRSRDREPERRQGGPYLSRNRGGRTSRR